MKEKLFLWEPPYSISNLFLVSEGIRSSFSYLSEIARLPSHVGSGEKESFSVVTDVDVVGDVLTIGRRELLDDDVPSVGDAHPAISVVGETGPAKADPLGDAAEADEAVELGQAGQADRDDAKGIRLILQKT